MLARVLWYALSVIRPGGPGLREREPSSGLGVPPERGRKREEEAVCSIWWEPEGSSRVVCCLFSWYTASLGCRRRHVVNPVSVLVVGEITLSKVKQTLCVCVCARTEKHLNRQDALVDLPVVVDCRSPVPPFIRRKPTAATSIQGKVKFLLLIFVVVVLLWLLLLSSRLFFLFI